MELNTKDELVEVIKNLQAEIESTKTELSETRQIVDTYKPKENEEGSQEEESNEDEEYTEEELDEVSQLLLEE